MANDAEEMISGMAAIPDLTMTLSPVRRSASGTAPQIDISRLTCVAFYGVMLSEKRLHVDLSGAAVPGLTVEEAYRANGEWLAVFRDSEDPRTCLVLTDPFGFQPLFHSAVEVDGVSALVVGTSLRGVAHERRVLGQSFAPDWSHVAATLASSQTFTMTVHSDRTPDASTRLMRPFEMLVVVDGAASFVERGDLAGLRGRDYHELLDLGIRTAAAQLAVLASAGVRIRRINLSGGKDSRLMIALLKRSGALRAFGVRTLDSRNWPVAAARPGLERDLRLSDTIRRHYGLEWSPEPAFQTDLVGPFEPLDDWQGHSGGFNYGFRFSQKCRTRCETVVELRGGGGETFRGTDTWQVYSSLPGVEGTEDSFEADARLVFDAIYRPALVTEQCAEDMFEHFLESLEGTGERTLLAAGDRHYTLYRNRGHFGTTLRFAQEGAVPFFPLCQVPFVVASGKLTDQERMDGAVFFDVIERTAPELNDLEFESAPWPEALLSRRADRAEHIWSITASVDELPEFDANQAALRSLVADADQEELQRRGHSVIADPVQYVQAQMRVIIDELSTLPGAEQVFTSQMVNWLVGLPAKNAGLAQSQLSKLATIRDAVVGSPAAVCLRDTGPDPKFGLRMITPVVGPGPARFRRRLTAPLFRAVASREAEDIVARTALDHVEGADLEFAYYLHRDGTVLERRGYSRLNEARFLAACDGGGKYLIQAFVRHTRRPRQVFATWSTAIE